MPAAASRDLSSISVGRTPLLDVSFAFPELGSKVRVAAKAEWTNPGGSVKDRAGYFIVKDALETGKLDGGKILLDSSSGNTGIAYAWLGARLGVKVTLAVPGSLAKHRRAILEAYGVELLFTDPLEGSDGAIREVRLMLKAEPGRYWYADQYSNPMTWKAHYETTGPELFEQSGGKITHFVTGLGTSGTFVGAGRRLRELKPDVRLVSMEPDGPMHGLEGLKHMETSIVPAIYDDAVADSRIAVSTDEAQEAAHRLARQGGILLGPSGGANLAAALRLGRDLAKQGREAFVATIFPDGGERYAGERFWEAVSLRVSRAIEEIVTRTCEAAFPDEGCGLLIGPIPDDFDKPGRALEIDEARPLPNGWDASAKTNRYLIDPRTLAKVEDELAGTGRGVVGFFHSHPQAPAWPSPFDLMMAMPCCSYWILRVQDGRTRDSRSWQRTEDGRSFVEEEILLEG